MFVSSIDLTGEVLFDVLRGEGEFIVRAPIGYDDETDVVYSAFVALSPLAGYADVPGYELVFNILEAAIDGSFVHEFWDGADTRRFLSERGLRLRIRTLIFRAVEILIDDAAPNLVSMTTHSPDLPATALMKYQQICGIFRNRGFTAGKADSWHGRHIWMMERTAEAGRLEPALPDEH